MGEPASDFVTSTRCFSAPELTPTLGLLNDTAPLQDNWMLWAMLPPPPPPSSSPLAAGSEPSSEMQPLMQTQSLREAPPRFQAQSRLDSQPPWNFQASTSWHWRPPPGGFPRPQKLHDTPGRLLLLSAPCPPTFLHFFPPPCFLFFSRSTSDSQVHSWGLVINNLSHSNAFLACSSNLAAFDGIPTVYQEPGIE